MTIINDLQMLEINRTLNMQLIESSQHNTIKKYRSSIILFIKTSI